MASLKRMYVFLGLLAAVAAVALVLFIKPDRQAADVPATAQTANSDASGQARKRSRSASAKSGKMAEETPAVTETAETADVADADEQLVNTFDDLTDLWMDTEKKNSPKISDINDFTARFKKLPEDRKTECLQRALNLIPDENIMLLVGILMDKTEKKEFIELVYNDVLNRGEDVKKTILKQIYKDKTHPCWADTAWIFDVTGENEKK